MQTKSSSYLKYIIAGVSILILILLLRYTGISSYLTLENIQAQASWLKELVNQYYVQSVIIYCLIFILLIALSLPITGIITILGGYLYGMVGGFIYSLFSASVGSILSFLVLRTLLMAMISTKYKDKLQSFNQTIQKYGYSYLLTLQLLMVPYVAINVIAALTKAPLSVVIWTTIIGSIPLIIVYTLAGQQLGSISSLSDVISWNMFILMICVALVALVPMIIKKYKDTLEV